MRLGLVVVGVSIVAACGQLDVTPTPTPTDGGNAPPDAAAPRPVTTSEPDATPPEPIAPIPSLRRPAPTARSVPHAVTCKVIASGRLDAIDVDRSSQSAGPTIAFSPAEVLRTMGLTRSDGVLVCDGTVMQIADNGSLAISTTPCDAVLADEIGIVVLRDGEAAQYADWLHVLTDEPFAVGTAGGATASRSALFYDQLVWLTADQLHLQKATLDGGVAMGTVTLERDAAATVRGVATTSDGRLVLTTGVGYEILNLFTGAALERGPVAGDSSSVFGAIACVTPEPFIGDCEDKADGPYCSTSHYDAAYECGNGQNTRTYWCGDGRACQAGDGGVALVALGEIDCRTPVRTDDSCTGLPDGTYCSVTGQPYGYACRGGDHAGSPYFCGSCEVADNGQAIVNPDGSPRCIGPGE